MKYRGVVLSFYKNVLHSTDKNVLHSTNQNGGANAATNSTNQNGGDTPSQTTVYKYMPLNIELTKDAITSWIQQTRADCKTQNLILFSTAYWYLDEISCVLIERNRQWTTAAIPTIKKIWDIILQERVTGYEHRNTKKKITVTTTDMSDSYMIQNMPKANSICLVKLE